jgi:protein SSD1
VGHIQAGGLGTRRSYNNNSNFGLHTLPEEGANDRKREQLGGSMTVDSLQDMINTLKTMPSRDDANRRKSVNQQRLSSSSIKQQHTLDINDNDDDEVYRENARAEAEAKLMGTYQRISTLDSSNSNLRFLGTTSTRPYSGNGNDTPTAAPSTSTSKRISSQQLPTLNENVEDGAKRNSNRNSRRIQFNKPLNLDDAKKQHRRSASYSSSMYLNEGPIGGNGGDNDWRASAPPPSIRHSTGNASTPLISGSSSSSSSLSAPSFNLVPFTPTRVNFSRDDANPHQRRQLFIAHLPFSALTPLFRSRQLVRGTLRVNKRNRSDAYVACEELDDDIYVCGSRDRNRALEGDVVAVRLVDVERVLREKKEKEEAKLVRNGGHVRTRQPDEEDENEIIFGGDEDIDVMKPKYCGVVVAILERAQNQVFSGTLNLRRPNNKRAQEENQQQENGGQNNSRSSETPRIVWFKAVDKRVPLIAIPIEQAPTDFVDDNESYADRLFVVSICTENLSFSFLTDCLISRAQSSAGPSPLSIPLVLLNVN